MAKIYIIKNTINTTVYIGQTSGTLESRLKHHFGNIKGGKTRFYNAMRELGKEHFYIELLEDVPDTEANSRELYWINFYKDKCSLYNTKFSEGKCGGDTLTHHPNIQNIKALLSAKSSRGNNSNASRVKVTNIITKEQKIFDCIRDCQDFYSIPRHDIVSRRCRGVIKKPYNNLVFEYCI